MNPLARMLVAAAALSASLAFAAPAGETRYQGTRLAFALPKGFSAREASDVAAEHAIEIVVPQGSAASGAHLRVLVAAGKASDSDLEAAANALRDARLKSRASWGVKTKGERRTEIGHVGGHRSVRLSDQMGSSLGASQQTLLCISASAHLVCGVADGPPDAQRAGEAVVTRALETLALAK